MPSPKGSLATWSSFGILCCSGAAYANCALAKSYTERFESMWLGDGLLIVALLLLLPRVLSRNVIGPLGQVDTDPPPEHQRSPMETVCLAFGLVLFAARTIMRWQGWFYR